MSLVEISHAGDMYVAGDFLEDIKINSARPSRVSGRALCVVGHCSSDLGAVLDGGALEAHRPSAVDLASEFVPDLPALRVLAEFGHIVLDLMVRPGLGATHPLWGQSADRDFFFDLEESPGLGRGGRSETDSGANQGAENHA